MAVPLPVRPAPVEAPLERPLSVSAQLQAIAGRSGNYGSGRVAGARLSYDDLSSFAWWVIASPEDRFRSSIQETAGDILRGVSAVDVSAQEAFPVLNLEIGTLRHFYPATAWERPTHAFEVAKRLQEEHVESYQYATLLGRLSRHYPAQILVSAQSVTGRATMTAREALQHVLTQWQATAPWLVWSELPEFLLSTSAGLLNLETQALALLQDESRPRSMRDILDEFLSIFVGYVIRANSKGEIEFVPPPWVRQEMPYIIQPTDVYDLSRLGEVDYTDICNRINIRRRGWGFDSAQAVMQPAEISLNSWLPGDGDWRNPGYQQAPGALWLGEDKWTGNLQAEWPAVPDLLLGTAAVHLDVVIESRHARWGANPVSFHDMDPVSTEYQVVELAAAAEAGAQTLAVKPLEYALPAGRTIAFGVQQVTVRQAAAVGAESIAVQPLAAGLPITAVGDTSAAVFRLDGTTQVIRRVLFTFDFWIGGVQYAEATLMGRSTPAGNITVWWADKQGMPMTYGFLGDGQVRWALLAKLNAVGQVWQQSRATHNFTFGRADEQDDLLAQPGFVASQRDFGILEKTLNASFFSPNDEQAMAIAQAYVGHNMWPVERFAVEQGPAMPVFPDDINRLVRLPNDVEGVVESWEYSDNFAFDSSAWSSGFAIVRHLVPDPADSTVERVIVTPEVVEVQEGATRILHLTVIGTGVYSHAVTWESSDPAVATVNAYGAVQTLQAGTVTITATSTQDPAISGSAEITVLEGEPE